MSPLETAIDKLADRLAQARQEAYEAKKELAWYQGTLEGLGYKKDGDKLVRL